MYYSSNELGDFASNEEEIFYNATRKKSISLTCSHSAANPHIEIEILFKDHKQFKQAVSLMVIVSKGLVVWVKICPTGVRGKCEYSTCPWLIHGAYSDSLRSFQVRTFKNQHDCDIVFKNKISVKVFVELVRTNIERNPHKPYADIIQSVNDKFGLDVNICIVKRAKKEALNNVSMNYEEEFGYLNEYVATIKQTNPGNSMRMQCVVGSVDSPPAFQKYYICSRNLKKGFTIEWE